MTRSAKKLSRSCLTIAMSIACACGSPGGQVDDPSRREAPPDEATSETTILPPVVASSEEHPRATSPPATSSASVQWPPGGKKCRLVHCANQVFFVGDAPGGWKGELELEVCVEDQCESMVVDLSRVKKDGSIRGRDLIAEVISAPLHCPPSLKRACTMTELGKRLGRQREGQSLFVLAINTPSTGKRPVEVKLTLSKNGAVHVNRSETVAFNDASPCHRPNGSGCEPECCESVLDF